MASERESRKDADGYRGGHLANIRLGNPNQVIKNKVNKILNIEHTTVDEIKTKEQINMAICIGCRRKNRQKRIFPIAVWKRKARSTN